MKLENDQVSVKISMTAIADKNDFILCRPFLGDRETWRCLSLEVLSTIIIDRTFRQTKSIKSYKSFQKVNGSSVKE